MPRNCGIAYLFYLFYLFSWLSVDHKIAEDEARKQNDQGVAEHLEAQLFPFAFGELTHLGRFENAEDHRGRKKNKVGVDNKRHL